MGTKAPAEGVTDRTVRVLLALGSAWSTFNLYPEPGRQPAFVRAASVLAQEIVDPITVGVGPGHFVVDDEPIELHREGAGRLARELFLHDVEQIRLQSGVSAQSLLSFFDALSRDEEHIRELGGFAAMLASAPPVGIDVLERGLLSFAGNPEEETVPPIEGESTENISAAAAAAQKGAEPGEVAELLLEESAHADDRVQAFLEGMRQLYELAEPRAESGVGVAGKLRQSIGDPWSGLRTFLEAFLHLSRPMQVWILEAVLQNVGDAGNRIFLDQLSDAEIEDFLPDLNRDASASLAAYATIIASEAGRPELDEGSGLPEGAVAGRHVVAARISEVLGSVSDGASLDDHEELRRRMSEPLPSFQLSRNVIRGLLECEDRDDRFRRVARVWAARVTRLMRDGDFSHAAELLSDVLEARPYGAEMQPLADEAIERIVGRDSLQFLVQHHDGPTPSDEAFAIVSALGLHAADPLVLMLADAEEPTERRLLIDLLARAIDTDPTIIDRHLGSHQWYVLRNFATVLGVTGRRSAVPSLRRLLAHDHPEVRIESMRSLVKVLGRDAAPHMAALLEDSHERVRQAAASLVRASDHEDLDRLLVSRLEGGRLDTDIAVVVIRILAARQAPEGLAAVNRLAAKRWAIGRRTRTLKAAAKEALEAAS